MGDVIHVDFGKRARLVDVPGVGTAPEPRIDDLCPKAKIFAEMMQRGRTSVFLLPFVEGVDVPQYLRSRTPLTLDFSWAMRIHDLRFDAEGIRGTLSFNKTPYTVNVPWDSVIVLRDVEGKVVEFFVNEDEPA